MSFMPRIDSAAPAALFAALMMLSGCGTPGAPQPPSLNLPLPVANLIATRSGNQVLLTWTTPKRNTDKLPLKAMIPLHLCRQETGLCVAVGGELAFAPGAEGAFTDTLPAALAAGPPRPLHYFVELRNRNGRSAGPSNAAEVLAGEAPAAVDGLAAEVRRDGMVLRWQAVPESSPASIRLYRRLLSVSAPKPHQGLLAPQPEAVNQSLLVDSCAPDARSGLCRALDKKIQFGQSYEYSAQRVARVTLDGRTLELAGPISAPVRVEALDIFPPNLPTGLDAVATASEDGAHFAIDLSWQPVSDANLAGYIVYRCEGDSSWQRISPAEPLVSPAFHDTQVQPGHTYRYAVSAIGQNGHESARSTLAEETIPSP